MKKILFAIVAVCALCVPAHGRAASEAEAIKKIIDTAAAVVVVNLCHKGASSTSVFFFEKNGGSFFYITGEEMRDDTFAQALVAAARVAGLVKATLKTYDTCGVHT